ncbi:zincin-like metallopeptidase domain-containing protein [Holdemanella biformis]|uniref:zincin-like metallopeptidase domain-containing protein n=1 Tax=Holdemanella biformis TaxID=1735 RepID=UPI0026DB3D37|nr:zincin-like metallopeptidase domain-containing protein [Holdemanella biformis]
MKNDKAEIVKKQLAERFIHCLDDKKEEWSKNWKIGNGACNGISNRKYAGLNRFLLTFYSQEEKYEGNRFYTFNQIKEKGYHLENAKGKGIPIIYPMFNYFKDGAADSSDRKLVGVSKKSEMIRSGEATESNFKWAYASVKYVFSEDLVKEIEKDPQQHIYSNDEKFEFLKGFMKETGVELYQSKINVRCYYDINKHRIVLPPDNHFFNKEALLSTLAHEIAHSTSKGLEREVTGEFGSEEYAKEELRAEIASAYICAELGIDTSMNENNNVAYIQSWSTAIKDNYKYLEDAVKDADKICNYVIEKGEVYQNKLLNKQLQKEYQTPTKEHKEKESERDL